MKKRIFGLLVILTFAFILILGTEMAYAKSVKNTMEYDRIFDEEIDFDADGVSDYVQPNFSDSNAALDNIEIKTPVVLSYEFEEGYDSCQFFAISNGGSWINFANDKKGKVKLLPGNYSFYIGETYVEDTYNFKDMSQKGIKEHVVFSYSFKKAKFKSVAYSIQCQVGDAYTFPIIKDGKKLSVKYTCNKKNKINIDEEWFQIAADGKYTVTAKAGGYKIKIKFDVQKPAFASWERTIFVEGENYKYDQYSIRNMVWTANTIYKFKSSDKSVAVIDSEGNFTAKKAGKATITVEFLKIKVKFDVEVVANEYHNENMKTDFRDLEDGGFYIRDLTIKFNSDGSISYSAYFINKNKQTMNLEWIRLEFYNGDGELIAKQKFENRKESVDYGDFTRIDFKISRENVYSKDIDLYDGDYSIEWYASWS